jgi:hypothetical protein
VAKDFTSWTRESDGFYEPTTLRRDENETAPVYAWFNGTTVVTPRLVGPKGSRGESASKIHPFKIFTGKGFFDQASGQLLAMDGGLVMATGDTRAGLDAAARALGMAAITPVPGWQTLYFGSNHLVTRSRALTCLECHGRSGVLDFRGLGYTEAEIVRLTDPETYFRPLVRKQREEWHQGESP